VARVGWTLSWALSSFAHRKARTAGLVGAVALATALLIGTAGFQRGYRSSLARNIEAMGYQVLLTGKGCPHEAATLILRGGSIPMYVDESIYRAVREDPAVADATRFLLQAEPGGREGTVAVHVGVDDGFLRLKPGVAFQRGGWFSSEAAPEAIVGFNVAEYDRLAVGDALEVRGVELRVVGVLEKLGTQDDGTVFLPLARAQALFERRDRLTGIGVRLVEPELAAAFVERAYELPSLQAVRMSQVHERMLGTFSDLRLFLLAFGAACAAFALLGVFNAAQLGVLERRREMGVLRSLGCSGRDLFRLVWSESLLVGVAGALLGAAAAAPLARGLEELLRDRLSFAPEGPLLVIAPAVACAGGALVVAACLAAALVPAWRAAVVPPMCSLRRPT